MTRDLKSLLGLTDIQASSVLKHLFNANHVKRARLDHCEGVRFRYWAIGAGPQPYFGPPNLWENKVERNTTPIVEKVETVAKKKSKSRLLTNAHFGGSHPLNAFLGIRI